MGNLCLEVFVNTNKVIHDMTFQIIIFLQMSISLVLLTLCQRTLCDYAHVIFTLTRRGLQVGDLCS